MKHSDQQSSDIALLEHAMIKIVQAHWPKSLLYKLEKHIYNYISFYLYLNQITLCSK